MAIENSKWLVFISVSLCCITRLSAESDSSSDGKGEVYRAALHDMLNTCLDARNHKSLPGPEDSLHAQCSPWANRACCTVNTSIDVHFTKMYKFDWGHCSHVLPLSSRCKRHFTQDLCFYECSPNVMPWAVKVNQKIRNQRFINVPLCNSDCQSWFNDCVDDYTCTDNWGINFVWTKDGNKCPVGSTCRKFGEIYNNDAKHFCETVWDHSWKVVNDNEHCMRLWFNPDHGNPNDEVARWKAEEILTLQMKKMTSGTEPSAMPTNILVPLIFYLFYYYH